MNLTRPQFCSFHRLLIFYFQVCTLFYPSSMRPWLGFIYMGASGDGSRRSPQCKFQTVLPSNDGLCTTTVHAWVGTQNKHHNNYSPVEWSVKNVLRVSATTNARLDCGAYRLQLVACRRPISRYHTPLSSEHSSYIPPNSRYWSRASNRSPTRRGSKHRARRRWREVAKARGLEHRRRRCCSWWRCWFSPPRTRTLRRRAVSGSLMPYRRLTVAAMARATRAVRATATMTWGRQGFRLSLLPEHLRPTTRMILGAISGSPRTQLHDLSLIIQRSIFYHGHF